MNVERETTRLGSSGWTVYWGHKRNQQPPTQRFSPANDALRKRGAEQEHIKQYLCTELRSLGWATYIQYIRLIRARWAAAQRLIVPNEGKSNICKANKINSWKFKLNLLNNCNIYSNDTGLCLSCVCRPTQRTNDMHSEWTQLSSTTHQSGFPWFCAVSKSDSSDRGPNQTHFSSTTKFKWRIKNWYD